MDFSKEDLLDASRFQASRSSGKGGQNVNKVSSKAELYYNLNESSLFSDQEKERIKERLQNRVSSAGIIQVVSQEERSLYLNKERCLDKLAHLLKSALHVAKPRKSSKPTKSSVEQRLKNKQRQALKKINRRNGPLEL